MFLEFARVLKTNGVVLIHGNGASNVEEYNALLIKTLKKIDSLVLEASDGNRLHRFRKI